MALSNRISARVNQDRGYSCYSSSPVSTWTTVIAAGKLNAVDGAPVTDPDSISDTDRVILTREPWMGNVIEQQVARDRSGNITTGKVKWLGRNPGGNWTPLRNLGGALQRSLTSGADDTDDGTYKYTVPDATLDRFDCGCFSEFVPVTEEALALSAGDASTAYLQARVISLVAQI